LDVESKSKIYFDEQIIQKLFQSQINSITNEDDLLEVKVSEGATDLLNISVLQNKTQSFSINNPILWRDATIIETPTIVQLERFITLTLAYSPATRQQRIELPIHYYDLCRKITSSGSSTPPPNISNLLEETKKIMGGSLTYKNEQGGIVYTKENGANVRSFNIATGVKSFGLLQLLLSSGAINPFSVLIIDEPEVHLHPKWELKYAKIIVSLSMLGIPIVISTHSNFFLEALTVYVKELEAQSITKIYFGKKGEHESRSIFIDVTDDLDPIFEQLARPMQELYLRKQ
jgi:hypothetical protein